MTIAVDLGSKAKKPKQDVDLNIALSRNRRKKAENEFWLHRAINYIPKT